MLLAAMLGAGEGRAEVAFAGQDGKFWQIWVMEDDGSRQRQVTSDPQDKRLPVWVDQKTLLYETNRGELFKVDVESGATQAVMPTIGIINGCDVRSGLLVCARVRGDSRDVSELFVAELDGGAPRTISRKLGRYRSPSWIEGGKAILYSFKPGPEAETIHRMDVDSGADAELFKLSSDCIYPTLAPGGIDLLFASNEGADFEIWMSAPAGTERRKLTASPGLDSEPRWMGSEILFVSARGGGLAIWKMRMDGKRPVQLTTMPSKDPAWIEGP